MCGDILKVQEQTLLPSQETLLQRLIHAACYNEQLTLIAGEDGSGKTTLVTALVTELEEYNSALVTCPLHADDAEIRRKILVQLLTDPLFDDEVPLADTILRLSSTLTRPLHLVIDDAHFLSQELWAELMILSKLRCADKPITITMTVTPAHMAYQMAQLSSKMKEMILPISIELLTLAEREALYQTLLSRSEQRTFTPREIVKEQLKKQDGTPLEVVSLINLALYGEEPPSKKAYGKVLAISVLGVLLAFIVTGWIYLGKGAQVANQRLSVTALSLQSSAEVTAYGDKLLKDYFATRLKAYRQSIEAEKLKREGSKASIVTANKPIVTTKPELTEQLEDALAVVNVQTGKQGKLDTPAESISDGEKDSSGQALVNSSETQPQSSVSSASEAPEQVLTPKYLVYTLQVANLNTEKSLKDVLRKLTGFKDIFVMKRGNRYIVFQGNFKEESTARDAAKKIESEAKLASPWLRQWQQLEQYQLLKHYPDGEITQ